MAARNGIANADERKMQITSNEFASRFNSKQECYRFVAQECSIALDDFRVTSIFHLKDIISGNRQTIKQDELKHIHVPQFPGITVEAMLIFARDYPEVFEVFPQERLEIDTLHRQYVANVIYTIAGNAFSRWIDGKLKERNQKLMQDKNLNIKMDPEIYKIFKNSESISGKYNVTAQVNTFLQFQRESVLISSRRMPREEDQSSRSKMRRKQKI